MSKKSRKERFVKRTSQPNEKDLRQSALVCALIGLVFATFVGSFEFFYLSETITYTAAVLGAAAIGAVCGYAAGYCIAWTVYFLNRDVWWERER